MRKIKLTNRQLLEQILSKPDFAPVAEDNEIGLMYSLLCADCLYDDEAYPGKAVAVVRGDSVCKVHAKQRLDQLHRLYQKQPSKEGN